MATLSEIRKSWFGDRAFYKSMFVVAIPLIVQQMITSFVNMLDNIMVGRTGTLQMSGVSVANQLIMIFNLALFGSTAAAAIFGAQYVGKEDWEGVRNCFRYKLIVGVLISILSFVIAFGAGDRLIMLFLNPETNSAADIAETLMYAVQYLRIIAAGMAPFALSTVLASTISETGETRLPMISSLTAVAVNFVFNLILIFGLLGFPALGCIGAAIATVIARVVQMAMNLWFAVSKIDRFVFFRGVFDHFRAPWELAKNITVKGFPLMVNEVLWSVGMAAIAQCYSVRGIDAIASFNIQNTITNLFFIFNIAMGDCISIMVGQRLGSGDAEAAVDTNTKLIAFTTFVSILLGILLAMTANWFPQLYNTSAEIKHLAARQLQIAGWTLWISAIYNAAYFTLRCGGKTIITFLFDSAGTVGVSFPAAYILAHYTNVSIVGMFFVMRTIDLYKVVLGLYLVKKRVWVNILVNE